SERTPRRRRRMRGGAPVEAGAAPVAETTAVEEPQAPRTPRRRRRTRGAAAGEPVTAAVETVIETPAPAAAAVAVVEV
ncbi:ATP-dependent helicase, partial [Streptomyces sp. SID4982]|nr:ATP-dependent helicase [Streptomyces sp. SID4982]